jgi:outer membrane protein assembly factor BamB
LIFNVDGGDVQYVIALDKKTGNTRWKTHRTVDLSRQRSDLKKAFSTPIIIDVDGRSRLISSGAGATVGYEPDSGKELWMVRHKGFSMSARPLMENGLLFLNTGFMLPRLIAVKTDGEGDVTESNIIWSQRRNIPTIPSSLLIDGRLYMVDNSGVASCREARSGDLLWKERIGGEYCASPIYANGRIYFFDRDGRSVVIEAADEFRELAVNELDEGFMASPAVVGDTLILRSITHLYRIEKD